MGRTRKAVATTRKHLTNAEKEVRLESELNTRVGRDELTSEGLLTSVGQAEFDRLINQATWLDNIARNDLILYCFYWERARALMNANKQKPLNPAARRALREYTAELRAISLKLGLSSTDRLRLAPPPKEPKKNKFLEKIIQLR